MVTAVTKKQKAVYKAIFWLLGLGRLDRSYSLHKQIDENNFQATFLFVLVESYS